MNAFVLLYGEGADLKRETIDGLLSEIGRRAERVYAELPESLFLGALKGESDVFVFGRPDFDLPDAVSRAGITLDGGIFVGDRTVVYSESAAITSLNAVVKKVKDLYGLDERRVVFRLYGQKGETVGDYLSEITGQNGFITPFVTERDRDVRCEFILKKNYSPESLDLIIKAFLKRFGSSVYADEDADVFERFMTVMKLYGRKLSVAESMTGGNIAATIVRHAGASEVLYEGLTTYDVRSKYARLGVKRATVEKNTVVSAEVAHEMARSLIGERSSVGISVTGYAPSVSPCENDGLCYIGVAADEKIKVYRYVFSGDRETVIKKATKAAVFSALKLITESFFES